MYFTHFWKLEVEEKRYKIVFMKGAFVSFHPEKKPFLVVWERGKKCRLVIHNRIQMWQIEGALLRDKRLVPVLLKHFLWFMF